MTFCLAWIVPTWVLLEVLPTKLPHYVLPTYPAIALLLARAIVDRPHAAADRIGIILWTVIGVALAVASIVVPILLVRRATGAGSGIAILVLVAVGASLRVLRRRPLPHAASVAAAMGALAFAAFTTLLLPTIGPLWPSALMAKATLSLRAEAARPVAVVGYREPSLVFLLAGDVSMIDESDVAHFFVDHPTGLVWVRDEQRHAVESAVSSPLSLAAVVEGWNLSKGERLRMLLLDPDGRGLASAANRG